MLHFVVAATLPSACLLGGTTAARAARSTAMLAHRGPEFWDATHESAKHARLMPFQLHQVRRSSPSCYRLELSLVDWNIGMLAGATPRSPDTTSSGLLNDSASDGEVEIFSEPDLLEDEGTDKRHVARVLKMEPLPGLYLLLFDLAMYVMYCFELRLPAKVTSGCCRRTHSDIDLLRGSLHRG